ncbi:hypothetical protein AK830_g6661 [Neonectria ditissima]|uniref:Peptidase S8/S53 domain-containing protein n=1 Tax=Neonectria ditissima TaxID=78410 RepID=A0A0P7BBV4_9HYPO|nr:hypothetical protein AK830_g6661 [Neonectria ditissima]
MKLHVLLPFWLLFALIPALDTANVKYVARMATELENDLYTLQGHNGIIRVIKLEDAPSEGRYVIRLVDGQNLDQCHKTSASLKALFGDKFREPMIRDGVVRRWVASLTTDNVEQAKMIDGVKDDIDANPERRKKSVVTMSLTLGDEWEDDLISSVTVQLQDLFARDVPFVCISGNSDEGFEGEEVDEYPALLEGPDLPIIVVGSVNLRGERSETSKGGPHVTIHAPRQWLVAGEIANLLSYETVPFDTSDGVLVENLKAYLQSDQGSWERAQGVRVLWNGVTEVDNPGEHVECNGLGKNIYVERDSVNDLIENDFCPSTSMQNGLQQRSLSVSRIYNEGTPNMVTLSIDSQTEQTEQDCVKYLKMAVDDRDIPSKINPANYKGGGSTTVRGATYRVSPGSIRAGAEKGKQAGCDSTYKGLFNDYWVWGHGWGSSDYGESLKNEIEGCSPLPGTWRFDYGIGDDGREWSARFRTMILKNSNTPLTERTARQRMEYTQTEEYSQQLKHQTTLEAKMPNKMTL